jgi:hypothetical protein
VSTLTVIPPAGPDCMFCDAEAPVAHVAVWRHEGVQVGRVCASHTLKELILDSEGRFDVIVSVGEEE